MAVKSYCEIVHDALATERLRIQVDHGFQIPEVSVCELDGKTHVFVEGSQIESARIAQKIFEQMYDYRLKGNVFVGGIIYAST